MEPIYDTENLTPEQQANIAECKYLRAAAMALAAEKVRVPELDGAALSLLIDRIDEAFGPGDADRIAALIDAEPITTANGLCALERHGVTGAGATPAEALIAWSIAARDAIKAGRT